MKMRRKIMALLLVLVMIVVVLPLPVLNVKGADNIINLNELAPFKGRTKQEVAAKYQNVKINEYYDYGTNEDYYKEKPSLVAPYAGGELKEEVHQAMSDMVNYYRWLAGVDKYEQRSVHSERLQAGAVIQNLYLKAEGKLTHNLATDWSKPDNMDQYFWNIGAYANHNIIAYNYTPQGAIEGWFNEGYNIENKSFDTIGHRKALLSYTTTGADFGYAGDIAYGLIKSQGTTDLPCAAYPAPGAYPSNNIEPNVTAWSVELNLDKLSYNSLSDVTIRVTNLTTNESYDCTKANNKLIESDNQKGQLVFVQPTVSTKTYEDPYKVEILGLKDESGNTSVVEYQIDFFDVNTLVPSTVDHVSTDCLNVYMGVTANNPSFTTIESILPKQVTITTDTNRTEVISVEWQYNEETNEFMVKPESYMFPDLINDNNHVLENFAIKYETQNTVDNSRTLNYTVNENGTVSIEVIPYWSNADIFYWYKISDNGSVSLLDQTSKVLTIENVSMDDAGQYFAVYKYSYGSDVYVTPIKTLNVISSKTLASIEITLPAKTQYFVGEDLALDDLNVKAIYSDNSSEVVDNSQVQISGFDTTIPGKKTITVTYQNKTATFEIDVIEKEVTSIKVTPPAKVQYLEGQELDLTGGKITVFYSDGSSEIIDLTNERIEITGYDKNKIGSQQVTVIYKNASATFTVNVKAKEITDISMSSLPDKVQYVKGQDLELAGGKILVRYNNGTSEEIDLLDSRITVTGYQKNKIGNQNLTVRYGGKTTSMTIEVVEKVVTSIFATAPTKVQYIEGQEIDLTGATITTTYNDGSIQEGIAVTKDMISGYDSAIFGNQTITVTYQNQISVFNVNVKAKSVVGIEMLNNPAKLEYIEGQELDLTDGKIKVIYDNGSYDEVTIKLSMISGYENNKLGNQNISVSYGEFTTQFTVNVIEKVVTKLELISLPNKLSYVIGQELNVEGAMLQAEYNDGEVKDNIVVTNDMCSGFDSSSLGTKTVNVKYEEGSIAFNVNVEEKKLVDLKITAPNKTTYIEGQEIDLSGLKVQAVYNDDSEVLLDLNDVVITGYDANKIGKQLITVTYETLNKSFEVEVINKTAEKIEITSPLKLEYVKGQELNLDGMTITVTYNNGEKANLNIADVEIVGYDKNKTGKQIVSVIYQDKIAVFEVNVIEKVVTEISISTPAKTEYIQGQKLDLTGVTIIAKYNDGTSNPISVENEMVSGYDANKVGKQTVVITFEGKTAAFEVEVLAKEITKMEITAPSKLEYIEGQELDLTGASILLTYNDSSSKTISIIKDMISGYDNSKIGKQVVNVTYQNQSATFEVNVIKKAITNIEMNSLPNKVNYIVNQTFDITGATFKVTYNNDETEIITVTNEMVTIPALSSLGSKTVKVVYDGFETSFNIIVRNKALTAIEIFKAPDRVEYIEGQQLDITGGKLLLIYDDNSKEIIDLDSTMCNVDMNQIGEKVDVEVSYNELKTSYSIKIDAKTVTAMKWIEEPDILQFKEGKPFIFSGKLELTYNNGSVEIINANSDDFIIKGYDNSKVGQQVIDIVCKGTNVSVDQTVEILPKTSIGLVIQTLPTKTVYEMGEEFKIDGLVAAIVYDNDTVEIIPLEKLIISKPDMNKVGKQKINLSDGKYKTSFEIEIIKRETAQNDTHVAVNTSDDTSIAIHSGTLALTLLTAVISLVKKKKVTVS